MLRSLFCLALSLATIPAVAVAGDAPTMLTLTISVSSGGKEIATASADTADRNPIKMVGTAETGQGYEVEVTPVLMPDRPDQVIVRSQLRVENSIQRVYAVADKHSGAVSAFPDKDTCMASATSRIQVGVPVAVLTAGTLNLPNGKNESIPGCSLTLTVSHAAAK